MRRLVLLILFLSGCTQVNQIGQKDVKIPFQAELFYPKHATYQDAYIKLRLGNNAPGIETVLVWDKTLNWPPYTNAPPRYSSEKNESSTSVREQTFHLNQMFLTNGSPKELFIGEHTYSFQATSTDGRTIRFEDIVIDLK